jgi:integrase
MPAPYQTAEVIAQTFAEATPRGRNLHAAAKALAAALRRHPKAPQQETVNKLVAEWRQKYAHNTNCVRVTALTKILRRIDEETGTRLAGGVPKPKPTKARQQIVTQRDLDELLSRAKPHTRLLVSLMLSMALRISEALRAAPENYNADTRTLTIKTKGRNGGKIREFPVPESIAALFELAPKVGTGGFVERLYGKTLRPAAARYHWRTLAKEAGIDPDINPHDLRRTAAVRCYVDTKDILAAKALLGHDSLLTTLLYLEPYDPLKLGQLRQQIQRWTPKQGGFIQ